jgi:hypothetical protein
MSEMFTDRSVLGVPHGSQTPSVLGHGMCNHRITASANDGNACQGRAMEYDAIPHSPLYDHEDLSFSQQGSPHAFSPSRDDASDMWIDDVDGSLGIQTDWGLRNGAYGIIELIIILTVETISLAERSK